MGKLASIIGNRIRELRKERGLRQEDMEKFGLSYKYYQRIEAGKINTTLNTLEKISEALGVEAIDLFALPLGKSKEVNELAATIINIIKDDNKEAAKKANLFIKEFLS
ncbi:MAG: helix-turn-helix transcriptional regulator [Desulfobacteraceae bacterium]|jgi:transcriptional regulator with XRE-family HTH domain